MPSSLILVNWISEVIAVSNCELRFEDFSSFNCYDFLIRLYLYFVICFIVYFIVHFQL